MNKINSVYLLLGANLGDPVRKFSEAIDLIGQRVGQVRDFSSIYSSPSWGTEELQPDYLNQVIRIETVLDAEIVLFEILQIETELGRVRDKKWGSRVIDIDILFYNSDIIDKDDLKIPHPLLHERNFVLTPFIELNRDFIHPVFLKPMHLLKKECKDFSEIKKVFSKFVYKT